MSAERTVTCQQEISGEVGSADVTEYLAAGVRYRIATLEDEAALHQLLRENDMMSRVRLSFEREPSYSAGTSLIGSSTTVIAYDVQTPGRPVGMYVHATLPVHINGQGQEAGYLGMLRVNAVFRHRVRILKHGFASIPVLVKGPVVDAVCFTSIAHDNHPARRLLESNLKGMPVYQPDGELETLAISTARGQWSDRLRPATAQDIPALVEFYNRQAAAYQFSPFLTEGWLRNLSGARGGLELSDFMILEDNGTIHGCLALWDQRALKQSVIRGYRFPLNRLRWLYNLWATLTGRLCLPPVGTQLEAVFIAFMAFDRQGEPFVIEALRHVLAVMREQGATIGVLGISPLNPVRDRLHEYFSPEVYRTCIDTVSWTGKAPPHLDRRPPQPEVALL